MHPLLKEILDPPLACMVNKVNKVIEINFQLSGAGNRLLANSVPFVKETGKNQKICHVLRFLSPDNQLFLAFYALEGIRKPTIELTLSS